MYFIFVVVSEETIKLWLNHVLFRSIWRKHSIQPILFSFMVMAINFLSNTLLTSSYFCSLSKPFSDLLLKRKTSFRSMCLESAESVAKHGLAMHDHVKMFHLGCLFCVSFSLCFCCPWLFSSFIQQIKESKGGETLKLPLVFGITLIFTFLILTFVLGHY